MNESDPTVLPGWRWPPGMRWTGQAPGYPSGRVSEFGSVVTTGLFALAGSSPEEAQQLYDQLNQPETPDGD